MDDIIPSHISNLHSYYSEYIDSLIDIDHVPFNFSHCNSLFILNKRLLFLRVKLDLLNKFASNILFAIRLIESKSFDNFNHLLQILKSIHLYDLFKMNFINNPSPSLLVPFFKMAFNAVVDHFKTTKQDLFTIYHNAEHEKKLISSFLL